MDRGEPKGERERAHLGAGAGDDGVPGLVRGHHQLLLAAEQGPLLLVPGDSAKDGRLELSGAHLVAAGAGGKQGGLIDEGGELGRVGQGKGGGSGRVLKRRDRITEDELPHKSTTNSSGSPSCLGTREAARQGGHVPQAHIVRQGLL